jgi:hypothetical protein
MQLRSMKRALLAGLLSMLSLAPAGALAQEPGAANNPGGRILGGHTFLFPVLQNSALVSTHVGIREGIAQYSAADVPLGQLGAQDISLAGLQQELDLSFRFTPWLAAYVTGEGQAVVGTNGITLVRRGGVFEASGEFGLAFRLMRMEQSGTQLALRTFGGLSTGKAVTVLPLLQSIIDQPGITLEAALAGNLADFLLVPTEETTVGAGLYLAQGFSRGFGLQFSSTARRVSRTESPLDATLIDRVDNDLRIFRLQNALALTYDFAAHGAPVGLMGEYLFVVGHRSGTREILAEDIHTSTVGLGVYYTGVANLQLGLTGVWQVTGEPLQGSTADGAAAQSEDPDIKYTQLILRYVW